MTLPVGTPCSPPVRHLRFMHEGYSVTAFSMALPATSDSKRYQSAFTLQGHAGDAMPAVPLNSHVFDSHAKALRFARQDAKRYVQLVHARKGCACALPGITDLQMLL